MNRITIECHTRRARQAVIAEVRSLLNEIGSITDFTMFSNHILKLVAEIPTNRLSGLFDSLKRAEISIDTDRAKNDGDESAQVSLVITFLHNDPDLQIPLIDFPG